MKIDRHNYEIFFLDHVEGRLSRVQEKELQEFLAANPDLAAELDDFEPIHLDEKEKIIFSNKTSVKKNENELTPVVQLIALMEGDLTQQEAAVLKKKIAAEGYLEAQSELLQRTKLVPDMSIRFPDKSKLKRRGKVVYMWRYAAVAAAACLIIGLTIVFRSLPDKNQHINVAQKNIPASLPVTPSVIENTNTKNQTFAQDKKPELQSSPRKKSIHKKIVSEQPEPIASVSPIKSNEISTPVRNEPLPPVAVQKDTEPAVASENSLSYRDIFSKEELNELQNLSEDEKPSRLQQLAKQSINRLGELTGVQIENQQSVFALSIGSFEVRHVSGK